MQVDSYAAEMWFQNLLKALLLGTRGIYPVSRLPFNSTQTQQSTICAGCAANDIYGVLICYNGYIGRQCSPRESRLELTILFTKVNGVNFCEQESFYKRQKSEQ
jgi:hypothetical protein